MRKPSPRQVARELARSHRVEDPSTVGIYVSIAPEDDEIRMIEVSGSVGYSGEVLPMRLKPRPDVGVPYATNIVLLNEREWAELRAGRLQLPASWGSPDDFEAIDSNGDSG